MIIEARGDVVSLRGTLSENHWAAVAAAVDLLLPEHPQGILMDCAALTGMTDTGSATFLNGLSYLEARGARIILCSIPEGLRDQLRQVPGLHSQVLIAPTVDAGRQSLQVGRAAPLAAGKGRQAILVPVNPPFSLDVAQSLLARMHPEPGAEVYFIYVMVVPRSLPVGAPLPEEEAGAEEALSRAERTNSAPEGTRHVVRGRNIPDAVVEAVTKLHAIRVVAGLAASSNANDDVTQMVEVLRQKCPCDFILVQERSAADDPVQAA